MAIPVREIPLHFKPLSGRILHGCVDLNIFLNRSVSAEAWHGRGILLLGRGVGILGSTVALGVATVESVAAFNLGLVALFANKICYQLRSPFLEKHSCMCFAYSMESSGNVVTALTCVILFLKNRASGRLYTPGSLIELAQTLFSAGAVHAAYCKFIRAPQGNDQNYFQDFFDLFRRAFLAQRADLMTAVVRDFGDQIRVPQWEALQSYVNAHPEDRQLFENFDLNRFLNRDEQYVRSLAESLVRIATYFQWIAAENDGIVLNTRTPAETAYQQHLQALLKNSFIHICCTPELSSRLDLNGIEGKERLLSLTAETFIPLWCFTVYQELQQEVRCPENFSGDLSGYTGRRALLQRAQGLLRALDPQEQQTLERKLLSHDTAVPQNIQECFVAISTLAASLNQGSLMTRTVIDPAHPLNPFTTQNLFQKACQEAIAEVEGRG